MVDEGQEVLNSYRLAFGHMVDVEEEVDGEISSALLIVSVCIKPDEPCCVGGGGKISWECVEAGKAYQLKSPNENLSLCM